MAVYRFYMRLLKSPLTPNPLPEGEGESVEAVFKSAMRLRQTIPQR